MPVIGVEKEFIMAASAFFAVLRDVTKLAATVANDLATQSSKMASAADEISSLASKAAAKAAGVAGDDLAVGAGQVSGVSPNRELPALWRISKGSFFNKLWLSALLLVIDHFAPELILGLLMLGACYLAYEGAEALEELMTTQSSSTPDENALMSEDEKVKGAIKTDIILSLEMLVIALATTTGSSLAYKIMVLGIVGFVMTIGVYGLIGLIIRLDDMGLVLAKADGPLLKSLGRKMVTAAPVVLSVLEPIGMVAMFAVSGGILLHAAHVTLGHWIVDLLGAIISGVVAGGSLVSGHHLVTRLSK